MGTGSDSVGRVGSGRDLDVVRRLDEGPERYGIACQRYDRREGRAARNGKALRPPHKGVFRPIESPGALIGTRRGTRVRDN